MGVVATDDPLPHPLGRVWNFAFSETARWAGVSRATLGRWLSCDASARPLARDSHSAGPLILWQDFVTVCTLAEMRRSGLSAQRARRALEEELWEEFRPCSPLAVKDGRLRMASLLPDPGDWRDHVRYAETPKQPVAAIEPMQGVEFDPMILGGEARIKGRRIPTRQILVEMRGDLMRPRTSEQTAADYALTVDQVNCALAYEDALGSRKARTCDAAP